MIMGARLVVFLVLSALLCFLNTRLLFFRGLCREAAALIAEIGRDKYVLAKLNAEDYHANLALLGSRASDARSGEASLTIFTLLTPFVVAFAKLQWWEILLTIAASALGAIAHYVLYLCHANITASIQKARLKAVKKTIDSSAPTPGEISYAVILCKSVSEESWARERAEKIHPLIYAGLFFACSLLLFHNS